MPINDPENTGYPYKLKILLSYDGTGMSGWQRQPDGQTTVQEHVERALSKVFDQPVVICGSSRTDSGVHALGQVCHAWVPKDPKNYPALLVALNNLTPPSIAFHRIWLAPNDFHAIANATGKTYKYIILNRKTPSALRGRYTHWVRKPLDLDYLNKVAQLIVGNRDFRSFMASDSGRENTVRRIDSARWVLGKNDTVEFHIVGGGFLKQMVRNLVGTMLWMHRQNRPPEDMTAILEALDRKKAGPTAPPQGLFLCRVHYPPELDKKCLKL